MAKKKSDLGSNASPIHRPFAGLAALRATMASSEGAPGVPEPAKPSVKPRFPDKLVLQREKKGRGGKTVTRLRGLSLSARDLTQLADEMKKALGCGASVEDGEVLLQGDQCQRAAAWLEKQSAARVIIGNW